MRLAALLTVVTLAAAGCGESKRTAFTPEQVKAALEAEHLGPERFVITVSGGSGDQTVPFDAAVRQSADADAAPLAMFAVLHTRAAVYVYASAEAAQRWGGLYPTHLLRVRNVVVLSAEGPPPVRRLRHALSRLH
jgi:hypothetical protein